MTLLQTPKQQSIFPDLTRDRQLINPDGTATEYFQLFLTTLVSALQNNYSPEGILVPSQTAANIAKLIATIPDPPTGSNIRVSNNNILYDSTNNEFKGNINGTWKTFTLT